MLDFSGLNYWAILVAWIIFCGVGSFWYSPSGFGKTWTRLTKIDIMKLPKEYTQRAIMYVILSSLLQAFTLAVVLNTMAIEGLVNGLVAGFFIAFGLTAATTVGVTFYSKHGWDFWLLNAGFFLVTMPINAAILSVWL